MLVKNAYGTTQIWQMSAYEKGIWEYTKLVHEKDIWDYTKLAHEQLFLLFPRNFGNNVQHFAMQIFYSQQIGKYDHWKNINRRDKIFLCTYNCFDQRMPNHSYDFFSFCHAGV
jgi:hypothetical protein